MPFNATFKFSWFAVWVKSISRSLALVSTTLDNVSRRSVIGLSYSLVVTGLSTVCADLTSGATLCQNNCAEVIWYIRGGEGSRLSRPVLTITTRTVPTCRNFRYFRATRLTGLGTSLCGIGMAGYFWYVSLGVGLAFASGSDRREVKAWCLPRVLGSQAYWPYCFFFLFLSALPRGRATASNTLRLRLDGRVALRARGLWFVSNTRMCEQ